MDVVLDVVWALVIALLLFVVIRRPWHQSREEDTPEWATCPYCLNPVRFGAVRCQHCHADIGDEKGG